MESSIKQQEDDMFKCDKHPTYKGVRPPSVKGCHCRRKFVYEHWNDRHPNSNVKWISEQLGISERAVRKHAEKLADEGHDTTPFPTGYVKAEQATEPRFEVKGEDVFWKFKHGDMKLTLVELDSIFYEYSKHGLNKSQVQVQNDHGFNAIEWQSLKRTFDLVKDSDVFSPYTLSLHTEKEACDMIASKIAEKYSPKNMRAVIVHEDNKQRTRAYENAIKEVAKLDYRRQLFEDAILEYVAEAKEAPLVKKTRDVRTGNVIVHVCDLHVGAEIEEERNLPAFNADVIVNRLATIAKETNQRKAKKVTLVINGDLIETFTGLNHINSWKNIDKKYGYGTQATIKATEILTDFIGAVNNIERVVLIAGNHDRVTSSNKEDVVGEIIHWVHYILHARYGKKFPVEWSKDVYPMTLDDCGFVFTHGHLAISKKNPDHIVNQYGFAGMFNLVVMAHLHSRKINADHFHNRTIHAPSIFTGNNFSKNLGYSSLSGYLEISVKEGLPIVMDVPLH